jgi:hypothetical protein
VDFLAVLLWNAARVFDKFAIWFVLYARNLIRESLGKECWIAAVVRVPDKSIAASMVLSSQIGVSSSWSGYIGVLM